LVSATGAHLDRLLTVREVAVRLGVCTSTVYKLCAEGKLAHVRLANAIRIAREALGAYLVSRCGASPD
jgi:excisionase family DNA binding protein